MTIHRPVSNFAICIQSDDPDLLTPRMIYEILPDESAVKSNYVRVLDNEGEDYLYPMEYFIFMDFPQAIQRALAHISNSTAPVAPSKRRQRVSSAHSRKADQSSP